MIRIHQSLFSPHPGAAQAQTAQRQPSADHAVLPAADRELARTREYDTKAFRVLSNVSPRMKPNTGFRVGSIDKTLGSIKWVLVTIALATIANVFSQPILAWFNL